MHIKITENYLWFPVDLSAELVRIDVFEGGNRVQQMKFPLGLEKCDYYAAWKVTAYRGKMLEIQCTPKKEAFVPELLRQEEKRPENHYPYRPRLHYTPSFGWVNDPNGLVYSDGFYHLFHQYNPYSTSWENMSWGHAVSRDLFHWKELDVAATPDEWGSAYSGCALVDHQNVSGYGEDAVLFFYTAAGGRNDWSIEAGNQFTQRRMWADKTVSMLHKEPGPIIPWMEDENRDPCVFWHEASKAYIMIMYLADNKFLILRSTDLKNWKKSQELYVPEMWECPLLMELPVKESAEKKWVFWSADGYYQVGNFDGYEFHAETGRQIAYFVRRPYAAQTFANVLDRVLLVPWIGLDNSNGCYRGAMGIPQELSLKKASDGYKISFKMAREIAGLRQTWEDLKADVVYPIADEARELQLRWEPGSKGIAKLCIGDTSIFADLEKGELHVDTTRKHVRDLDLTGKFDPSEGLDLSVIIDQEMIDILGADGTLCGTVETEENILGREFSYHSETQALTAKWCILR